jgi:glucosylglycerate phosphorylase
MDMQTDKPRHRQRTFYDPDPDYTKPLLELSPEICERIRGRLRFLYGEPHAERYLSEFVRVLRVHHAHKPPDMIEKEKTYRPAERFSEQDMILITYGDLVQGEGATPLSVLHDFVRSVNSGAINTLHILPFFPYSSDRGFAVVDFKLVDPQLGSWADILLKKQRYDLMFDAVLNHVSSRSEMFMEFINGNPLYKNYFIAYDSPDELTPEQRKKIFRPRTSDILTRFETIDGPKWIWTTFSDDQIDLNFRNPEVLKQVLESVLFYIRMGADILRLDAVTYIWAEPGTESVHLPQTHEVVKLLRDVVDAVASGVALVTETNVPHQKNISYFGNGYDEAHMVYNFALPPLVLHTFYREDARAISRWAAEMEPPSELTAFFNILDTHDGIGLMGVKGILSEDDVNFLVHRAESRGAYISYKMTEDRRDEPYEINTTWWSAINGDGDGEDMDRQVQRYLASRSIALVLKGVPGIYLHGVLGTPNDHQTVSRTGVKRDVNRAPVLAEQVAYEKTDPGSKLFLLLTRSRTLYMTRTGKRAFHPRGSQKVLPLSPDAFCLVRQSPEGDESILSLINVTGRKSRITVSVEEVKTGERHWRDLLSGKYFTARKDTLQITLEPYGVVWLQPDG